MEKKYMELEDLLMRLKAGVESVFPGRVWVKAEVGSLSMKQNGHCYLDLLQGGGGGVTAKVRGTIWASRWNYIDQYFRSVTGASLDAGMEILARVQVNFHPLYGLSLNIDEVDPDFTLGANERLRQQTIERLAKEGLMNLQKRLRLPDLPYSLAVISAPGAAGFGDFLHHLLDNEYGFVFHVRLFEALMQGEDAPDSMVAALSEILSGDAAYDAVLIMRGGGSELDLACFDDYGLAVAIARCPIPVFTAIGHLKDHHVADMVANTFVKTPTALADLFLDCFIAEDSRLASYASRLQMAFSNRFASMASSLALLESRVGHASAARLREAEHRLSVLETRIGTTDPRRILERGFVLALDRRGGRMRSAADAKIGERLQMMFADGTVECGVVGIEMKDNIPPPMTGGQ